MSIPLRTLLSRPQIGPITAAELGMPTVDVGNPMLSMHSAREMAGAHDPEHMQRALTALFAGAPI